eukprot:1329088-Prymnesium_polylepis.1
MQSDSDDSDLEDVPELPDGDSSGAEMESELSESELSNVPTPRFVFAPIDRTRSRLSLLFWCAELMIPAPPALRRP